jgi:hypothetical protein
MLSRHLIFEEDDPQNKGFEKGYWLGLANESSNLFGFGAGLRPAGLIRMQATVNGEAAEANLSATHAMAELKNASGSIRFAIDGPALLLEGRGLGLKLRVRVGPGEYATRTENGCILVLGATRYIIEMKKGSCHVETRWNLLGLTSYDPELTLVPEGGVLEAVFWDCDTTYRKPAASESVSAAADKAEQSFAAFCSMTHGTNELYKYVLWLAHMQLRGQVLVVGSKAGDVRAVMLNQCLAALAFKDAERVFDMILSQLRLMTKSGLVPAQVKAGAVVPEAAAPLWGYVLLLAGDFSAVPKEKLEECDALLRRAAGWWEANRRTANGEFFYAYPHESGWEHSALIPEAVPVISPDLAGWMAFNYLALQKLAGLLGRPDAEEMLKKADAQIDILRGLWNGEHYVCRSVIGGHVAPCTAALGLLTCLLGERLPAEIKSGLKHTEPSGFSGYIAGLLALQFKEESAAWALAGAENEKAGAASRYDPALCAILLALEGRR